MTAGAVAYDFFAPKDIFVPPMGCTPIIFFNVKAIMPKNVGLQLLIRSSLAAKHCIVLETSGLIDSDYANNLDNDGNIGIKFRNNSDKTFTIKKGERCAQGYFFNYLLTSNDSASGSRSGGYGSTGSK